MKPLSLQALADKVASPEVALARISTTYQPGGGQGSRVFPPTFPTSPQDRSPYLMESRVRDGEEVGVVVLDQVPSVANRCEEGLKNAWEAGDLKLPMLRLTHSLLGSSGITGLDAPHRAYDAYWRDSLLDGVKFDKTSVGQALQGATADDASALLKHDPTSLVYGTWNSHRKGRQVKFPRLYSSEIVGWKPLEGSRKAGRMDPVNLTGTRTGDGDEWAYAAGGEKSKGGKLSEIGHGNIAPQDAHGGVTIAEATRFTTISLTALARLRFGHLGEHEQQTARVLLAALALLGDRLAFGGAGVWLRSGCDLVVESETLEWVGRGGVIEEFTLDRAGALELYEQARAAAEAAGVQQELQPVELTPSPALAKAIEFSVTKAESAGE